MSDSLQIKQFNLSEKDELFRFLKTAYADNPRLFDPEFWEWHYLKNPLIDKENMPIWIARNESEILGQLAAIPVRLKVGAEHKQAMWILDFIVAEKCRGKGIGKKLVLKSEEFCPLGLGVNTHKQHSPELLQRLGWKIVSNIPRFNKILFPGETIREITEIKPLRNLINLGFAPLRPRLNKNIFKASSKLKIVENFDSSFEMLWQSASTQWSCSVERNLAYLSWQYREQPAKKFDVIGYYEQEKLLGYAVMFFRKENERGAIVKAALTDICYHSENAEAIIDELLAGAVSLAVERRAGSLVTDVIDSLTQKRLEEAGFWRTKNPLLLMVKSGEDQELLYDSANWFLTRGDSDTSINEPPNL